MIDPPAVVEIDGVADAGVVDVAMDVFSDVQPNIRVVESAAMSASPMALVRLMCTPFRPWNVALHTRASSLRLHHSVSGPTEPKGPITGSQSPVSRRVPLGRGLAARTFAE